MKILTAACRVIIKRPFILWFFSVLALVWSLIDFYNPITPILMGFSNIGSENSFSAIVSLLQFLLDPSVILPVLLLFLGISAAAALLGGVLLSGYFFIVNNAVNGKKKYRGEFFNGVRRNFPNIALMIFATAILGFATLVFFMIASVPAVVISRASSNADMKFLLTILFIGFLTITVIYFLSMFFRVYFLFWYTAVINSPKNFFQAGKQVSDRAFWKVFRVMLAFDAVFIVFQLIFFGLGTSFIVVPIKWIFRSLFYPLLLTYFFGMYKLYTQNQSRIKTAD